MNPTYSTRYTLLERAKSQSDSAAWEELIGFYRRYIYVIIRSMGVNNSDTEDVLQQVLIELWKYLPDYEYDPEKSKFRSWVSVVTRNQVISFVRRSQSHLKKLDKAQQQVQESYLSTIKTPEVDEIFQKEWELFLSNTAFENIAKHFSPKALEAFQLFAGGVKVNEISNKLDVKADSIYKYISRIKVKLVEEVQSLKQELDF
ncbi:MAG: sigma-70 family RNA polymerase sigma factor [Lentisphaeraceae bacterium]|nr:sigma-70 family RNA polymerase sigma factor [Lentisphaeraceae bacterium]